MDDKENVSLLSNVSSINVPANESATKEIAGNAGEFSVKVEATAKRKYYRQSNDVADKQTEAEERREAALNQMRYLLSLCEKYSELYKKTLSTENSKQLKNPKKINKFAHTLGKEDIEGIQSELKNKPKAQVGKNFDITEYLTYFQNGKLHPYQVEGVSWLYTLFMNGTNGILADEMGLGKTVQIIALICVLLKRNVSGPFLIVAPLSTIPNWASEFKRFAPEVPVVVLYGKTESRQENLPKIFMKYTIGALQTYPVVITSYQVPAIESGRFLRMKWKYIIVDEGHRIKNHKSQLALKLREFKSENRIILTGTPLQNNMMELWALLNFLLPTLFNDMETFTELFLMEDIQNEGQLIKQEESNNLVSKIHKVLTPFMLRRLKKDVLIDMVPKKELLVYCPMSDLQLKLYQSVIDHNFAILTDKKEEEELALDGPRPKRKCTQRRINYRKFVWLENESDSEEKQEEEQEGDLSSGVISESDVNMDKRDIRKINKIMKNVTMQHTMMMFRKIVSHPYLVHFPLDPNSEKNQLLINEDLVNTSGKLQVLDVFLPHLMKRGHRVLLFSQLCIGLDLIEEYMIMRKINYRRLDGSHDVHYRAQNMKEFNEDPSIFIFLISTRAGGLGLNLTGADTVIFFDRDWNPQADIQAQDRCHRIGQTKPVVIYTLVTKNTIDEQVLKAGKAKRLLEKIVISKGTFKTLTPDERARQDLLIELRDALQSEDNPDYYIFSNDMELNRLLDRSDLYAMMDSQRSKLQ